MASKATGVTNAAKHVRLDGLHGLPSQNQVTIWTKHTVNDCERFIRSGAMPGSNGLIHHTTVLHVQVPVVYDVCATKTRTGSTSFGFILGSQRQQALGDLKTHMRGSIASGCQNWSGVRSYCATRTMVDISSVIAPKEWCRLKLSLDIKAEQ